jgi:hypothetical protein
LLGFAPRALDQRDDTLGEADRFSHRDAME